MKHTPNITAGTVHLWRIDTPVSTQVMDRLALTLSDNETQRANSLVNPKHRTRFIARRGLLRKILADQLNISPANIVFIYGSQGKPMLCPRVHPDCPIQFNLTHCNDLALLAITVNHQVGIDLEAINLKRNIQGIGERYFHPSEWQHIAAMPAADQPAAFFDNWACKEAVVKAHGQGIVSGLSEFIIHHVSKTPGKRTCEHLTNQHDKTQQDKTSHTNWMLRTLQLTGHDLREYRVAIALPLQDWQLSDTLIDTAEL